MHFFFVKGHVGQAQTAKKKSALHSSHTSNQPRLKSFVSSSKKLRNLHFARLPLFANHTGQWQQQSADFLLVRFCISDFSHLAFQCQFRVKFRPTNPGSCKVTRRHVSFLEAGGAINAPDNIYETLWRRHECTKNQDVSLFCSRWRADWWRMCRHSAGQDNNRNN